MQIPQPYGLCELLIGTLFMTDFLKKELTRHDFLFSWLTIIISKNQLNNSFRVICQNYWILIITKWNSTTVIILDLIKNVSNMCCLLLTTQGFAMPRFFNLVQTRQDFLVILTTKLCDHVLQNSNNFKRINSYNTAFF